VHVYTAGGIVCGPLTALIDFLQYQKPHRFHFIGHGMNEFGNENRVLGFTDKQGNLQQVDRELLVGIMGRAARTGLRLVVLNACETEVLGHDLHRAGVPFVIWAHMRGGWCIASIRNSLSRQVRARVFRARRIQSRREGDTDVAEARLDTDSRTYLRCRF